MVAVLLLTTTLAAMPAGRAAEGTAVPNFWDQRQRLARQSLSDRPRVRFLTSVDYPPFDFLDQQGRLTGFDVDLARLVCDELEIADRCQIEARPFAELVPALQRGEGEAVIAGVAVTADNRRDLAFTESYFRYPARFVARRDGSAPKPDESRLSKVKVGTVRGSAHAAMLAAFFPEAERLLFDDRQAALDALRQKTVDAVFGDGVFLSFWLDSDAAGNCCAFTGGPYLSDHFLGEGLAIAVPKTDEALARAFDYALGQVVAKKRFSELMLRYFPTSAF
ncbi:transporter substrate-binding domain-containing protein [Aureimonas endophytica]|uniref:transporter substrate-binding domain-containing protein n=1 Tax=Aureimonas endophytica TaxID=2027858 RepID=UPI001FCE8B98|nr:transporter substrate-binding domain-containing protein [Aureimonas endophytica]